MPGNRSVYEITSSLLALFNADFPTRSGIPASQFWLRSRHLLDLFDYLSVRLGIHSPVGTGN